LVAFLAGAPIRKGLPQLSRSKASVVTLRSFDRSMPTLAYNECMSPRAKPKRISDEFDGFGSPVPKFNTKPLLEEKCDAFQFSTPVPKVRAQLFDDGISTAAPSPAMTDVNSAWTTPTLGCSTPSFLDMTKISWGVNCAPSFEAHMKLDGVGAQSAETLLPFTTSSFADSGMMGFGELWKEPFNVPIAGKDLPPFTWPYNPNNLSLPPMIPSPVLDQSTPPGTPRKRAEPAVPVTPNMRHYSKTTPPPAPKAAAMPPLLRALHENSTDSVRRALEQDPDAATSLFWEHGVEPPVCAAVRLGCCPEVVGLLLEHQADVNGVDNRGRTPLAILASRAAQSCMRGSSFCDSKIATARADVKEARHIEIERLLIQAGGDENHSSIAAARHPQEAIRPFLGIVPTSSSLPWDTDIDLTELLREAPPPL